MLDVALKQKSLVPAPSHYKLDHIAPIVDPKRHNPITARSPRITEAMEIEKTAKKHKRPSIGTYNPKVKERLLLGYQPKSDRVGYIEDAQFKAKASPGYITCNYKQVQPKALATMMYKPVPQKEAPKTHLGPATYQISESYNVSQRPKPRFYINDGSYDNFISQAVKKNRGKPGVGAYHIEKSDKVVTRGLSKGWK